MKQHLVAYAVRETRGKSFWTRIGVAFPNEGPGFNLILEAMPASVDGQFKIVVLPPKAEDADAADGVGE